MFLLLVSTVKGDDWKYRTMECSVIMSRITALHNIRWTVIVVGTVDVMKKSHTIPLAAELNF